MPPRAGHGCASHVPGPAPCHGGAKPSFGSSCCAGNLPTGSGAVWDFSVCFKANVIEPTFACVVKVTLKVTVLG